MCRLFDLFYDTRIVYTQKVIKCNKKIETIFILILSSSNTRDNTTKFL